MALLKGRHLAGCVGVCLRESVSHWVSVMKCVLWIMNVCCNLSKVHIVRCKLICKLKMKKT